MSNTTKDISTRLQRRGQAWYTLALVSTTLQPITDFSDEEEKHILLKPTYSEQPAGYVSFLDPAFRVYTDFSSTVLPPDPYSPAVETAMNMNEEIEMSDEDFTVKPIYVNEVRIRVGSFRIDRSLPKIFAD